MANINRKWASGIGEDGNPVYAPKDAIVLNGRTIYGPKDKHYEAAGFKSVSEAAPSEPAPEGHHYEARGYAEDESRIWRVYETVANPPAPPRVFSKLKCVAALMEAGVWHEVKGYIEGAGLYDLYLAAQDFREDNPYFVSGKAQLMTSLGWTEEQAEAILAKCVIG